MQRISKQEFITRLADTASVSEAQTKAVIDALAPVVTGALKVGEAVQIPGIGTLEATYREEREGRNPSTGEAMTFSAKYVPKFKAVGSLKEALAGLVPA